MVMCQTVSVPPASNALLSLISFLFLLPPEWKPFFFILQARMETPFISFCRPPPSAQFFLYVVTFRFRVSVTRCTLHPLAADARLGNPPAVSYVLRSSESGLEILKIIGLRVIIAAGNTRRRRQGLALKLLCGNLKIHHDDGSRPPQGRPMVYFAPQHDPAVRCLLCQRVYVWWCPKLGPKGCLFYSVSSKHYLQMASMLT